MATTSGHSHIIWTKTIQHRRAHVETFNWSQWNSNQPGLKSRNASCKRKQIRVKNESVNSCAVNSSHHTGTRQSISILHFFRSTLHRLSGSLGHKPTSLNAIVLNLDTDKTLTHFVAHWSVVESVHHVCIRFLAGTRNVDGRDCANILEANAKIPCRRFYQKRPNDLLRMEFCFRNVKRTNTFHDGPEIRIFCFISQTTIDCMHGFFGISSREF